MQQKENHHRHILLMSTSQAQYRECTSQQQTIKLNKKITS